MAKLIGIVWIFFFVAFPQLNLYAIDNNGISSLETLLHDRKSELNNYSEILVNSMDLTEKVQFKFHHIPLSDISLQTKVLDKIEGDYSEKHSVYELFYANMTDSLLQFYQKAVDFYQIQELKILTEELYSVAVMSTVEGKYHLVYKAILDFWMQFIFEQLQVIVQQDESLKYTYEYQFIQDFGERFQYQSFEKLSNSEKVIDHFSQNKWFYLWDRFLLRTTIGQKSILAIVSIGFLFSVFYTMIHLFKRRK